MRRLCCLGLLLLCVPLQARADDPATSDEWVVRGLDAYKQKNYSSAISSFDKAIQGDPTNATAYLGRGMVFTAQDVPEKAVADYSKAIDLDPKTRGVRPARRRLPAVEGVRQGSGRLLQGRRTRPDVCFGLPASRLRLRPDERLSQVDRRLLQGHRTRPEALVGLQPAGFRLRALKQPAKSIDDCSKALELNPSNVSAYVVRAGAYVTLKDYAKAKDDASKAVELDPKDAPAHAMRGAAYKALKEYSKSADEFSKAIELDPKDAEACNLFAWLLATCPQGDIRNGKKAIEYAAKACDLSNGKDASCLGTLAAAHAEAGEFDEAAAWEQKALDLPNGYAEDEKERARQRLKLYKDGKAYHED